MQFAESIPYHKEYCCGFITNKPGTIRSKHKSRFNITSLLSKIRTSNVRLSLNSSNVDCRYLVMCLLYYTRLTTRIYIMSRLVKYLTNGTGFLLQSLFSDVIRIATLTTKNSSNLAFNFVSY